MGRNRGRCNGGRGRGSRHGTAGFALWWLARTVGGSLVMWLVDPAARRLLPLAALLRLLLVFPDRAPSRFRAAMELGAGK